MVIRNGINTDEFQSESDDDHPLPESVQHLFGAPKRVVIGTVGRLDILKGQADFIRAAQEVLKAIPTVEFFIVGEGKERKNLERLISEKGLGGRFHLLGLLKNEDLPEFLRHIDIFVFPSHKIRRHPGSSSKRWPAQSLLLEMMLQGYGNYYSRRAEYLFKRKTTRHLLKQWSDWQRTIANE